MMNQFWGATEGSLRDHVCPSWADLALAGPLVRTFVIHIAHLQYPLRDGTEYPPLGALGATTPHFFCGGGLKNIPSLLLGERGRP